MPTQQEPVPARFPRLSGTVGAQWEPASAGAIWPLWLAALVALGIGVTLILDIHPIGDGMWFWYATDLRHGVRLYRDLHLPLQPMYVLATALFQTLLGTGWLASKVFPLLQLLVLTALLVRLARFVPWAGWQRGLLALVAFLLMLQPSTYRFDDYHVTSDIFTLGSLLLLVELGSRPRTPRAVAAFACAMGVCCGLAGMTRLNDGAALVIAAGLCLVLLYSRQAVAALSALAAGMLLAFAGTLLAVRESPADWWRYSIAGAGAIKGGTGNILYTPLLLPWHLLLNMLSWKTPVAVAFVGSLFVAVHGVQQRQERRQAWRAYAALAALVLLLLAFPLVHHAQVQTPLELLVRLVVLLLLLGAVALTVHVVRRWARDERPLPRPAFALLLFPLLHLLGGALTASNALPDPYLSLAMVALLAPLLVSVDVAQTWSLPVLANLALVGAIIAANKARHPYQWWTYDNGQVYRNRVWYQHPDFGPMYIERPQLALMRELCGRVQAGQVQGRTLQDAAANTPGEPPTTESNLLSMPFPYANYFCNVPPWHGYVQTWYDTSSAATIQTLVHELQTAPPRWIAYEYDPVAIVGHEITYFHGKPIAHRALKSLVEGKIASGEWTLREHRCSHTSEWLLLETVRVPDAENELRAGFKPEGDVCR